MRNSRGIEKKALETATLSIGAPVGDPGGGSFTETFERQMKEGSENGASLINFIKLIWTLFFWIQIILGAECGGNLELV